MPLFESVEGDLTTFFVAQGSVFDSLVKSFMERMALMETRINTLTLDVSTNSQNVTQRIHTINANAASTAAAVAALADRRDADAASSGTHIVSTTNTSIDGSAPAVDVTHMGSDELEYYIMTLSRQLHLVLELFFQPYAHDAIPNVQSEQAHLPTISDVLTQNEAILMQLSALGSHNANGNTPQQPPAVRDANPVENGSEPISEAAAEDDEEVQEETVGDAEEPGHRDDATSIQETEQQIVHESTRGKQESLRESRGTEEAQMQPPDATLDLGTPNPESSTQKSTIPEEQRKILHLPVTPSRRGTQRDSARRIASDKRQGTGIDASRGRKKSLYDSFRDFHELQMTEEERQRLREEEMLRKVQQLLLSSRRQWQEDTIAMLTNLWQQKMVDLERQQSKMQTEWKCYQEQQASNDVLQQQQQLQQQEFDRQFTAFSNTVLSTQRAQEQQIARILEKIHDLQSKVVQKEDFDSMAAAWLQSARDECVFGVNANTLDAFKRELEELHTKLNAQEASPEIESLVAEVNRVLELLAKVLEILGGNELHSPQGFQAMQTLRTFLTMLDEFAQKMQLDQESSAKSTAFISETLRQMELGTANLLEAFESQQDRYQQAFEQQHSAIAQLQRELWEQNQADQELKNQLAGCPSQEETMRFIQELRDQINTSTLASATRMLETVDELRSKMGGLPNAEIIERLAHAIQTKADRAEMDRLASLLAASNSAPVAPIGSLMKTPMRCLSCDQALPYVPTGNASPEHHGGSHPHSCTHEHPQYASNHHQPQYYYTQPGSPTLFKELFATSTAAARRRKQRQLLNSSLSELPQNNWTEGAAPNRAFVNLDDGRNRMPLRKTTLSDRVVYGPAITPNAFKKRGSGPVHKLYEQQTARPKTAMSPDRRGEIITRSVSSTFVVCALDQVVIRPFAEQSKGVEKRTNH